MQTAVMALTTVRDGTWDWDIEAVTNFKSLFHPVPQIGIDGMLPPGPWPKQESSEEISKRTKVKKFFRDNSRLAFLESLGTPVAVVDDISPLNNKQYQGVVMRTKSERLLALVDCPVVPNALYVFDTEVPDWKDVAKMKKFLLRSLKPQAFVKKIPHTRNYQTRVLSLLNN